MHRRLLIQNFRSIEKAEVDLTPFTVVVGPNGSGKSNFVDALVFLRELCSDAETAVASRGGIGSVIRRSRTRPYDLRLQLSISKDADLLADEVFRHDLTIRAGGEGGWQFKKERIDHVRGGQVVMHVDRTGASANSEGNGERWHSTLSERASAMIVARDFKLLGRSFRPALLGVRRYRLNPDSMRQPQLASETHRLQETGANIASAIRAMRDEAGHVQVLATMQRIVPGLRDIRVVPAGRHELLEFDQDQRGGTAAFSASEISEGALRALGVVVAAQQMERNELLVIEEPEANVHAGAANLIFDVLREAANRGAVLITTHSPELLDAAEDENILVCSYSEGVTRVGPLDKAQRDLVREGLFRLADLMRSEPLRIEGDLPEAAGS